MAQRPFLKSIQPVNLLSFGPETPRIELRPLNILIGPNGSGKSNLIEIIRLLSCLPDKEPWSSVLETGGVDEWIWQGKVSNSSITSEIVLEGSPHEDEAKADRDYVYSISLSKLHSSFLVTQESVQRTVNQSLDQYLYTSFSSNGMMGELHLRSGLDSGSTNLFALNPSRSVLSQLTSKSVQDVQVGFYLHELFEIGDFFESLDFHQDWEFGVELTPRDPRPVGQPTDRLREDAYNLAQMIASFRDYHRPVFDRMNELMKRFYEPVKSIEVRLISSSLQLAILEENGFSVSAFHLSDGTLRWMALLAILLNPTPAPVTCIDEPELGLHPDMIPVLADLLRDAMTRTQLIVTTHSTALVDAFSDAPEAICVCEKFEGATTIRRLNAEKLKVWLEDYTLGHLWASGQIGGNRW